MRRGTLAFVFLLPPTGIACSVVLGITDVPSTDSGSDAQSDSEGSSEAANNETSTDGMTGRCNPSAPFGMPQLVDLGPGASSRFSLAKGETLGVFERNATFYQVSRASPSGTWSAPMLIATQPSLDAQFPVLQPNITEDGLTLYFTTNGTFADFDIWTTTRSNLAEMFSARTLVSVSRPNKNDISAFIGRTGELSVTQMADNTNYPGDLAWAQRLGDPASFGPAQARGVNTVAHEDSSVLSPNGLVLYFSSDRNATSTDIFRATRGKLTDDFTTAVKIDAVVQSKGNDSASWVSEDDCVLYFYSNRNDDSGAIYATFQTTRGQ